MTIKFIPCRECKHLQKSNIDLKSVCSHHSGGPFFITFPNIQTCKHVEEKETIYNRIENEAEKYVQPTTRSFDDRFEEIITLSCYLGEKEFDDLLACAASAKGLLKNYIKPPILFVSSGKVEVFKVNRESYFKLI